MFISLYSRTMSQDGESFCPPSLPVGQAQQQELEPQAVNADPSLGGRRRGRKRKREEELGQLQRQVLSMHTTLQELVQAQRPSGLRTASAAPGVWDRDPDELSIAASDSLEGLHSPQSEAGSPSDVGETSSQASEPEQLDPSDRAVIVRAAARAQLAWPAPPQAASVFDRGSQRRRSDGLPVLPDFMAELHSSWGAPSSAALPRSQLAILAGAETYGVAAAPRVGPTFTMMAGATARAGRDASHPNRRCRATDGMLRRAYHASATAARLACSNSLLLVYLEGLLQDLATAAPSEEAAEMLRVADLLLRGTSAHARSLGQSMASMVQARRQVWLSRSNLSDQDCIAVLAAPVLPGEVFGPPCEAALEQSRRTRELTRSMRDMPPSRLHWGRGSFLAGSAASRVPRAAAPALPARGSQSHRRSFRDDRSGTARFGGARPQSAGGRRRR